MIDPAIGGVLKQLRTGVGEKLDYENMCLDPTSLKLYSPNVSNDNISVIDCQSDEVIRVIPTAPRPSWLAVNPRDHKLYCTHDEAGVGLSVIDCDGDTVVTRIPFPGPLLYAVWHEGVNKVYALDDGGLIYVLDGKTNQVIKTLPRIPDGQLCPPVCDLQDDRLYVITRPNGGPYRPALYSIDARLDSIIDSLPQLHDGAGLTWNASSNKLYFWAWGFLPDPVAGECVVRCEGDSFLKLVGESQGWQSNNGLLPVSHPSAPRVYLPSGGFVYGIGILDCNSDSVVDFVRFPATDGPMDLSSGLALDPLNSRVFEAGRTHIYCVRDELPAVNENRVSRNRQGLRLTCSFERGGAAVLISVASAEPVKAALTLCDITGRAVRSFALRRLDQQGEWHWDLRDNQEQGIPSGIYFCRLTAKFISATQPEPASRTWKLAIAR